MKRYDLRAIVEETLIEYMAQLVVDKLINRRKKAVVVFTGAGIGFNQSIKSLKLLKEDGWELEIVLSKGAEDALTIDLIKDLLSVEEIVTEDDDSRIGEIFDKNNLMIIPCLTINTASKIANCISDNFVTNLISRYITEGRPIVAAVNGCCPDNEERNKMGFSPTESYKSRLRENINTMREYGIHITIGENLYTKTSRIFSKPYGRLQSTKAEKSSINPKVSNIESRVITRTTILENAMYDVLNLRRDSIITDLAREEAERHNIHLIKDK